MGDWKYNAVLLAKCFSCKCPWEMFYNKIWMKYNKNQIKAHSLRAKQNSSGFSFGFKARKIIYLMNFCCCSEFQKKEKDSQSKGSLQRVWI